MSLIEFLGFGGYSRPAEGYMSWQHLTFVTALVAIMFLCGIILGKRNRTKSDREKNRVLIVAAMLIDSLELFKIIVLSVRHGNPFYFVYVLPLFMCSIQLITIPVAAFAKGRVKEVSLDFVTVFGLLGALLGTYFAGQNYGCYPVISLDNVVSGITHCISGFASLYILISGMRSMKKRDIPVTSAILGVFCMLAYLANLVWDCNYMFLSRGDATPYEIVMTIVGGSPVLYPIGVVLLFIIYIVAYYNVYYLIENMIHKKHNKTASADPIHEEAVTLYAK